ncbi:MAG: SDR family NAD(P)-dependent oxidoreductase [Oxalobacteraceae bacterium]|nr:MAG: SDR family NAD(P)-dependent oxidoreductase [Oxalobacteraceae bacterium]
MKMIGNTILITGGTSGIGLGLADAFADRGNTVIVTGRTQAQLDALNITSPALHGMVLDLDDPLSLQALKEEVLARFPALDMLIANAGISGREDLTADDWDMPFVEAMIRTNVMGVLAVASAFLPHLRRQPTATFIVTGSKLAYLPSSAFPTYCATKAFLHSWIQSLRHQLRSASIEVLELLPPYVATKITGEAQLSDPRAMPLATFIDETMELLEDGNYPQGEILVERARADRNAEREGRYVEAFVAVNPA